MSATPTTFYDSNDEYNNEWWMHSQEGDFPEDAQGTIEENSNVTHDQPPDQEPDEWEDEQPWEDEEEETQPDFGVMD